MLMLIFKLQYEVGVLVIFIFMFYVRMTKWAKGETLMLIQQIRNSNVWSTKSKNTRMLMFAVTFFKKLAIFSIGKHGN